ncbi:MAG: biotin--[acetyl-CoA-carboxylase] ligase [bacterium]
MSTKPTAPGDATEVARRLGLPRVEWLEDVGSTLDVAHALAADGAESGTLVLADAQTAGRGRMGRTWASEPRAGLWLTLIERPRDVSALDVLSLRVGLALAPVLDAFTDTPVRVKWPNDLYVGARKLAGILIEARWRSGRPDWVALGVGINVRPPAAEVLAAGLRDGTDRMAVLDAVVPAIRRAASISGPLGERELAAFASRDLARGQRCTSPMIGTVAGIDSSGALLIDIGSGGTGSSDGTGAHMVAIRTGSLVLTEDR